MASEQSHAVRVFSAPRDLDPTGGVAPTLRLIVRISAGVAGAAAAVGLIGWIANVPELERLAPTLATMKFNTALSLLLLAVSFFVPRIVAVVCTAVAGLVAMLQLIEYATLSNLGIDQLVFTDHSTSDHPGRTSIAAAACLLLVALARSPGVVTLRRTTQALALADVIVAGLALLGYLYGIHSLYSLLPFSSTALHTALALILLGIATLAATEDGAMAWLIAGRDAGATLLRSQLPLTLIGLPLIGFCCLGAHRLGWVNAVTTVVLVIVLCTLVIASFTWVAALRLSRVDGHRVTALDELTDLTNNLERQVVERAAQVQSRRDEIAVLEDRQRIAADLHDIVIQRLFAAGMFLQGTDTTDPDTRRRIETAVESMDHAIKDLRASIFELGGSGSWLVAIDTALDDVCAESARVLGFLPSLTVDDPDAEAETMREDLLAALRESLSNVARHAQASAVEVVVRTGNGLISLTVTDDGAGMTRSPHSSGTRNMAERARQHGGDCVWTTVQPHGTRVWWHVPGASPVLGQVEPLKQVEPGVLQRRKPAAFGDA